jgi:hypothetical protein
MNNTKEMRTIYELTNEEFNELKVVMLFDDCTEFYEDIDEISDESVINKFGKLMFRREDFSCNLLKAS